MNKFLKLSTTALLLSGLAMSGAAMAATKTPTLRADKMTVGASETVGISVNVAANDSANGNTVSYTGGKAKYGSVTCTTSGMCTYTPNAKAKGKKSDSFIYTVSYTDAKGKPKKRTSRVNVKLVAGCVSC
ncbi:MAG: hypothetical protein BWK73_38865 [Thiothrix lacustris]|uniref:Uncharacterized protein n=1 Tax=Thiothrix lacustris TaxID=525917 RepID=A0A1Y1QEG6_9GAMM|nr:MAG: hypothetical protein BWK73_38865 [Thiothrix lacustris]